MKEDVGIAICGSDAMYNTSKNYLFCKTPISIL